jgi:hypothetical protein
MNHSKYGTWPLTGFRVSPLAAAFVVAACGPAFEKPLDGQGESTSATAEELNVNGDPGVRPRAEDVYRVEPNA